MKSNAAIITEGGEKVSYDIFCDEMEKLNKRIDDRSLVIIISTNTIGSVVGYVSCIKNRNVPIVLRANLEYYELRQYILDYKVNYVWLPEVWMNLNDKIMDEDGYRVVYSKYDYALLRVSKEKICMNDELALLVTIPRQSGNQRLVRLSYDNILSSTKSICKCLDITYNDVAITSMPMSYVYGMFVLNTHLYKKATIILNTECYYTEKFWKHFQMYGGTSFSGVPYMYEILIAKGVFNNDMKNLKNMTVSGGKLGYTDEKYLIKYAEKYNKRITVMYGYAEATAQICYRPYQDISRKIGSIGIAIPDGSMWLENQQRDIVDKPFIHGDIIYGGRNVCMGYAYNYKDLEKGDVNNGIFRTGDIGYIDENGYFYILDRSNGSENVDDRRFKLKEMERQLREKYYV